MFASQRGVRSYTLPRKETHRSFSVLWTLTSFGVKYLGLVFSGIICRKIHDYLMSSFRGVRAAIEMVVSSWKREAGQRQRAEVLGTLAFSPVVAWLQWRTTKNLFSFFGRFIAENGNKIIIHVNELMKKDTSISEAQ